MKRVTSRGIANTAIVFAAGFGILTFWVGNSCAQSVSITGTVVDSSNSQAISGATVRLVEYPQITTTTAANGTFTLAGTATIVRLPNVSTASMGTLRLIGSNLSISNVRSHAKTVVDVFTMAGALTAHVESATNASGNAEFNNLWKAAGRYSVRVKIDKEEYALSSSERVRLTAPLSAMSGSAKTSATYTVEVNAANFAGKRVGVTSATADAGTIKLAHLSVQTGVWTNVTPAGISLDPNFHGASQNFGMMDVLVDPVRLSDCYLFTCYQGVWKSTDAGATWTKITATGTMDVGRAWGECIDLNINRNPATPPTMWACQGYGQPGEWKSTDGGVNWTDIQTFPGGAGTDPYSFQVDPYDSKHLITGLHEGPGINESTDGGATWHDASGNIGGGISMYPFFINTGNAATTRTTWLSIAQTVNAGADGTWRTVNGGASWSKVSSNEHPHGGAQIYQNASGVYMAGVYAAEGWGVLRSTDYGATWTHVGSGNSTSNVFGTPNHIYATCCGAINSGTNDPHFTVGSVNGSSWTSPATPAGLINGPKNAGVAYDASIGKYVLVGGCWLAGVWRYIEP